MSINVDKLREFSMVSLLQARNASGYGNRPRRSSTHCPAPVRDAERGIFVLLARLPGYSIIQLQDILNRDNTVILRMPNVEEEIMRERRPRKAREHLYA
jgi:hypothetical protein